MLVPQTYTIIMGSRRWWFTNCTVCLGASGGRGSKVHPLSPEGVPRLWTSLRRRRRGETLKAPSFAPARACRWLIGAVGAAGTVHH